MGPLHILAATLLATGNQRQIEHKEAGKTACQLALDWLRERLESTMSGLFLLSLLIELVERESGKRSQAR